MSNASDIYGGRDPRDLPSYTIPRASRLVHVPSATLRYWVLGRHGVARPVIKPAERIGRFPFLSFTNLVEAHVLSSMRKKERLALQKIRKAISYVESEFGVQHPLIREQFKTDGVELFVEKFGELVCVSKPEQGILRKTLEAHLRRIEYGSGTAIRLFPLIRPDENADDQPRMIVIDPRRAFGRPVLEGTGVPVSEIADRFRAGESVEDLSDDFGVSLDSVQEALRAAA